MPDEPQVEETTTPSLDELIAEFETNEPAPQPETPPPAEPGPQPTVDPEKINSVVNYVEQQQQRETRESERAAIDEAVKTAKEVEGLSDLPDIFVEGALSRKIASDPRLQAAWQNQHNDPAGFNRLIAGVAKDLAGELTTQPDAQLSADREAANASVRTQSGASEPETPDVRGMPHGDVIALSERLAAQNPRR